MYTNTLQYKQNPLTYRYLYILDFFTVYKSNLQKKQLVTILLVSFLFLFMIFTLVLARYLSEKTEQEDVSAYSDKWYVEAQCKRPTDLNNLSYDISVWRTPNPLTKTPQKGTFSICLYPKTNATHNYVYTQLFDSNATWKDTTQNPPVWACYSVANTQNAVDNYPIYYEFSLTPTSVLGYDSNPSDGLWHKTFAEFNTFINNMPSQYDKNADYNASVVITYTDGTVDDQLRSGLIKGGNKGCRPTATLNTTCSASSQNNTMLAYDLQISGLYPTPLYGPAVQGYDDRLRLQMYMTPATNDTHKLVFEEFFGGTADASSGGTNPAWVVYNITDLIQFNNTIVNTTFKWDSSSTMLRGNKSIDELAQFISTKSAEGSADKNTTFGTKAVLTAYGNTNDQIIGQSVKINKEVCGQVTNTPTPTPGNVLERIQPDNFSQVVLNNTGDYFYYRSCEMDKSKDEGVDFTKCKNNLYENESWIKHSVKSLMIPNGTQLVDKARSIDVDQREGAWTGEDLLRDIVYFTVLSYSGDKIYTRSCNIQDNLDTHLCSNWTTTNVSDIAGLNLTTINSIENTTYYRNGKYYTFTKILDPISDPQAPGPYSYLSRECQTHPEPVGANACSSWVRDSRQEMMNNYKSLYTYVFDKGSDKRIKESFLTDVLGTIENYVCTISKTSTTPFTNCARNTANTKPATDVESLGIPYDYSTSVVIEDASSLSAMVSDLSSLDLPAECRNVELVTDSNATFPGSIVKIGFNLNTKPAIDDSSQSTITMTIPNGLERVTSADTIKPNQLCQVVTNSGVNSLICAFNNANTMYEHFKIKSNVNPGDQIQLTSKSTSTLGSKILEKNCPNVTFDVVSEPVNTPTPSVTPSPTPRLLEPLTCVKTVELPNKIWTGREVSYVVKLNKAAPGPKGTVVVRDDISEEMEMISKPNYCEIKTQEVQASVMGISDHYAERGSLLISVVLISILSGGVTYIILTKRESLNLQNEKKRKPVTAALVVTGVVLLIGGIYFLISKDDISPSDTPAQITGSYLECNIPKGVKKFTYRMQILGEKNDVITNKAEVYTGDLPEVNSCEVSFTVTGPDIVTTPTVTPSVTDTPEFTPTPSVTPTITDTPEFTPTPSVTPTITDTPEVSPTPTDTTTVTDTPELTPTEPIVGFVCGAADVDGNGRFTIYDFGGYQVGFASYYRKTCDDTEANHQSYGVCGGKDVDKLGTVDIGDFASFAQRYNKESCAL